MANPKKIKDVISRSIAIGDEFHQLAIANKDTKAADTANQAYRNAIKAQVTQLQYKQLTGRPEKIDFLED